MTRGRNAITGAHIYKHFLQVRMRYYVCTAVKSVVPIHQENRMVREVSNRENQLEAVGTIFFTKHPTRIDNQEPVYRTTASGIADFEVEA